MNYLKNLAFSSSHNIISHSGVYIDSKAVLRRGVTAPDTGASPHSARGRRKQKLYNFDISLFAECRVSRCGCCCWVPGDQLLGYFPRLCASPHGPSRGAGQGGGLMHLNLSPSICMLTERLKEMSILLSLFFFFKIACLSIEGSTVECMLPWFMLKRIYAGSILCPHLFLLLVFK